MNKKKKWIACIASLALVGGAALLIRHKMSKKVEIECVCEPEQETEGETHD